VHLVLPCVKLGSLFLINGLPEGHIIPSRGIHQGNPMLTYLFMFYYEGLSYLLLKAILSYYPTCSNASIISQLLFADDAIIFRKGNLAHVAAIEDVLRKDEKASSQMVSFSKLTSLLGRVFQLSTHFLDICEVLSHDKYLSVPTFVGRSWKNPFFFPIVDHIQKHLSGWMD